MTIVDIQVSPAHRDWAAVRDACQAAERSGFGACWVYDHLAGAPLGGHTMLECFTLLGALAAATTTIELGTLVANVWNRQVGTLVVGAASVTQISGRQFHLGIGAGTSPTSRWATEQLALGHDLADTVEQRHARVEQVLDLTDHLWHGRTNGAGYDDATLATLPVPSPVPTLIVGVNSVRLSRIAGERADGVNVAWKHPRRDQLLAAAGAAAGDRPFIRTAWTHFDTGLLDPEHPERRAMAAARLDRLILAQLQ